MKKPKNMYEFIDFSKFLKALKRLCGSFDTPGLI